MSSSSLSSSPSPSSSPPTSSPLSSSEIPTCTQCIKGLDHYHDPSLINYWDKCPKEFQFLSTAFHIEKLFKNNDHLKCQAGVPLDCETYNLFQLMSWECIGCGKNFITEDKMKRFLEFQRKVN